MSVEIPYPPVFHDWKPFTDARVSTCATHAGVAVEVLPADQRPGTPSLWHQVELTEQDASLLAAALLQRAGQRKLSRKVLKKLNKDAAND